MQRIKVDNKFEINKKLFIKFDINDPSQGHNEGLSVGCGS